MSKNARNSTTAEIESLGAAGLFPTQIAHRLGCEVKYVKYVLDRQRVRGTPLWEGGDDDKHIDMIALANRGMGFPVLRIEYGSAA